MQMKIKLRNKMMTLNMKVIKLIIYVTQLKKHKRVLIQLLSKSEKIHKIKNGMKKKPKLSINICNFLALISPQFKVF